jgi:putative redox protein
MSRIPAVRAVSGDTPYVVTLSDATHEWLSDEPQEAGGGARGPAPHELLLSSLGACTAISLRMYANRKGWPLEQVTVELRFNPDGPAANGGSDIHRHIVLRGELSAEQHARLLEVANACPLHRVLLGEIRIATSLT